MKKRRTLRKRGSSKKRSRLRYKKVGGANRTYIFIIAYRARSPQEKRREQIQTAMASIRECFTKYNKLYKIIVTEQDNSQPFNIGLLKNIGFLEGEKLFTEVKVFFHFNVDYFIDSSIEFPKELDEFDGNGVLDIFAWSAPGRVGGPCCFNSETFTKINGLPNNIFGYGPEDITFKTRVDKMEVPHITSDKLHNVWIKIQDCVERNTGRENKNFELIDRDDPATNGLSTCKYVINGPGEFDDPANNVHHLLADFEFTESQ